MPLSFIGLSLLISIGLCVHAVKTGQQPFWLWVILFLQPIGAIVYAIAVLGPQIMGGPTVRRAGAAARDTLDPGREYRRAQADVADSPTVHNRMRLAAAAGELGRWDEAERLYAEAAQGVHADDPALMNGLAHARVELGKFAEALPLLERLSREGDAGHAPQLALLLARAHEGLGQPTEAERHFRNGGMSVPGLEGIARYAAFLARQGRMTEARDLLNEIDARLYRTNPRFQREGRAWRDLAAREIR